MLEHELTDEFIYNNVTLYITTVPAGSGGSFLGYLQRYHMGLVNYRQEKEFPHLNRWDGFRAKTQENHIAGHNLYNIFNERIKKNTDWGQIDNLSNQTLYSAEELTNKFNEGLPYATKHTVRDIKLNGPFPVTNQGNYGILWHSHEFPYGVQEKFKKIKHILSVEPSDIDTHNYYNILKSYKNGWNGKYKHEAGRIHTETRRQMLYDNKIKFNTEFPPEIAINYKKFFLEVDKDEIKKYLIATLPINGAVNDHKLDYICNLIKIYTKLNKELINQVGYQLDYNGDNYE